MVLSMLALAPPRLAFARTLNRTLSTLPPPSLSDLRSLAQDYKTALPPNTRPYHNAKPGLKHRRPQRFSLSQQKQALDDLRSPNLANIPPATLELIVAACSHIDHSKHNTPYSSSIYKQSNTFKPIHPPLPPPPPPPEDVTLTLTNDEILSPSSHNTLPHHLGLLALKTIQATSPTLLTTTMLTRLLTASLLLSDPNFTLDLLSLLSRNPFTPPPPPQSYPPTLPPHLLTPTHITTTLRTLLNADKHDLALSLLAHYEVYEPHVVTVEQYDFLVKALMWKGIREKNVRESKGE